MLSNQFSPHKGLQFLTVIIFSLGFFACNSGSVFEENVDIENKTWLANDSVQFSFRIDAADLKYDIFYNVRNTITYPYHNLYINYYLKDSQGDTINQDLVDFFLFEPKTGKPYGKGLGDIFSHQFKMIPQYQFPDTGVYSLEIKQYMRQDSLPEILSVGISIKEALPSEE